MPATAAIIQSINQSIHL